MTLNIDPIYGPTNYWWNLGDSQQEYFSDLIPKDTTTWDLKLTKNQTGLWCFSEPTYGIINETLCNGTEKCIDTWYEKLNSKAPKIGDTLSLTISKEELSDYDTEWYWCYCDSDWTAANYYLDLTTKQYVWLCPLLQILFKGKPLSLYLKLSK